ncbi:tetratricopeptide repeat protein [Sulfurimonas sp.]
MLKWILLSLLSLQSFALEISIDSAKDNFIKYSTLHLNDEDPFTCQEIKNEFDVVTKVVCAFSKKPSKNIKSLQNDFFRINSFQKKDTFFIVIKPFYKLKLIADIFDLTVDNTLFNADVSLSRRWSIVGFKNKMPLLKQEHKPEIAINFPFYLDKDKMPYVGSLDIKGNPVHIKSVDDVSEYLRIKKYYKKKNYESALELINDVLAQYPNTLFRAELIFYKIKVYDKIKDYENVIANAKEFLREYSGDENIPEVLSLLAKAYAKVGQSSDADYFFDRLFSEHSNSIFAQWGYIYKGEMLEASGGVAKAVDYYKKALYETKSIEVAASAAFHLARINISVSPKAASKYIMKIVQAKAGYFMQEEKASIDMMHQFADEGYFDAAAAIAQSLLNEINPTYDEYEGLLKDVALWLAKTKDKKTALQAINKYLTEFPDGDYIDLIQEAKDRLFFDTSDLNATAKLMEFNKLIQEYANDSIGQKALYEKAKLLLKEKKYNEVLSMKDQLESLDEEIFNDVDSIINQAAIGAMQNSLQENKCNEVLEISNEYNITLSSKWDDSLFACATKGGDFTLAKKIASKNLKSKNLAERKKWLYRYITVDFDTGNYSEVIEASKDLITLISDDKNSPYQEVYRYLFDTYQRLEKQNKLMEAMNKIEEIFGVSYKDIDRYVAMVTLGESLHDDTMVIKYGTKVMRLEKNSTTHAQSPYIEFALYQAYMDKNELNKAYEVIHSLDAIKLSKSDRARAKYLQGRVLSKLWRDSEAKVAYEEAIKADEKSAWAKLAKSALEL